MRETLEDAKTASQGEMLYNRLKKRYKHLKKWARRVNTDAWRLYDRDIPEIPLLIDIYGDAVSGALYQRPYEKDWAEEEKWLSEMKKAVSGSLELPESHIFLKQREHQRGQDQYQRVLNRNFVRDVHEGGLNFRVNLSDYLDTGLFLDHRKTRDLVRSQVKNLRVLNLFCYTGSFSVYAADGNAAEVDSVDLSNTYLEWAEINFSLNNFKAVHISPENLESAQKTRTPYRLIRGDGLRFIDEAAGRRLTWDYIILDPPTFSNSKKMKGTLDICRDHEILIKKCLSLLTPGGKLLFSTNARGFKMDGGLFPGVEIRDIQAQTTDEDFTGKRNRSCYLIQS